MAFLLRGVSCALLLCVLSACGASTRLHLRGGESVRGDVVRVTEETYTLDVDHKPVEIPAADVEDVSFAGKPLRVTGGSLFFGGSVSLLMYSVTMMKSERRWEAEDPDYDGCEGCIWTLIPFGAVSFVGMVMLAAGGGVRDRAHRHLPFTSPSRIRRNRRLGRLFTITGAVLGAASPLAFLGDDETADAGGFTLLTAGGTLLMFGIGYLIRAARLRPGRRRVALGPRGLVFDASL